ncbi:glycosyltransferase family 2 protein [Shewanella sp. SR44-3]|uniref:glycosyltransferase family 2 protein n=1 Tax=Shewanella sp. SR44-3 TaxID=2760936 RepID=UPI0015F7A4BB|nr:glycosyltransferase family 2 protein [Shewanella sp. SR44-3]MBB1268427.1 glycosyltransferase family 2 protein [Shewanella sp. SR44-3]
MSTVTLIITTYNWPAALDKTLQSLLSQSRLPNEVIIADDGSTSETKLLIEKYQSSVEKLGIKLLHSWQADEGFRVSRSRNLAISKATSKYIICIDGDIIMDERFIADHMARAVPGCFISGKRARLSEAYSRSILNTDTMPSRLSKGIARGREAAFRSTSLSKLFSKKTKSVAGVHSCNLSFWREDAIRVNGFNAAFVGWGAEDKEFCIRLVNSGLLNNEVKFTAVAYHIYHKESSKSMAAYNQDLFDATSKHSLAWCEKGLNEFMVLNHHKPTQLESQH